MIDLLHYLASALGIAGALLNASGRARASYAVWLPSNVLGLLYAVLTLQYGLVAMFAVFLLAAVWGLRTWSWDEGKRSWMERELERYELRDRSVTRGVGCDLPDA